MNLLILTSNWFWYTASHLYICIYHLILHNIYIFPQIFVLHHIILQQISRVPSCSSQTAQSVYTTFASASAADEGTILSGTVYSSRATSCRVELSGAFCISSSTSCQNFFNSAIICSRSFFFFSSSSTTIVAAATTKTTTKTTGHYIDNWLICWFVDLLAGWLIGGLVCWLIGLFAGWVVFGGLDGLWVVWFAG